MAKLGISVLLVLLLGALAWQAVEASSLRGQVEQLSEEAVDLRAAVDGLERRVRDLDGGSAEPALRTASATPETTASAAAPEAQGAHLLPLGARPEVIAQAVRELQGRVSEQEARVAEVAEKVETADGDYRRVWKAPRFISSVEDAQKALDLSSGQRADIERIVEYAKRDLEDLRSLPNADGKTWKDVEATKTTTSGEGFTMVMTNLAEVMKYRNSKIPGSDETYGAAEQRIQRRATTEIRDRLTPEQQKTWDESQTHGLLGPSTGGANVVSLGFATAVVEGEQED